MPPAGPPTGALRGGGGSSEESLPVHPRNCDRNSTSPNDDSTLPLRTVTAFLSLLRATFNQAKAGLEKEKDSGIATHTLRWLSPILTTDLPAAEAAARDLSSAPTTTNTQGTTTLLEIQKQLGSIEKKLTTPGTAYGPPNTTTGSSTGTGTWAKVAAAGARPATTKPLPPATRHTVRARINGGAGLTATEALQRVRATLPQAVAINRLRSGDIDITMATEEARDSANLVPSTEQLSIIRKEYVVEVPAVPLTVPVRNGKHADNSGLITATTIETQRLLTGQLTISAIRWLHESTENGPPLARDALSTTTNEPPKPPKTEGSLLISLATQRMQHAAIRHGIVINGQFFWPRMYDNSCRTKQCFNCQQ